MNGKRTARRAAVGGVAVVMTAVFMLLAFRYRDAARVLAGRARSALRRPEDGETQK